MTKLWEDFKLRPKEDQAILAFCAVGLAAAIPGVPLGWFDLPKAPMQPEVKTAIEVREVWPRPDRSDDANVTNLIVVDSNGRHIPVQTDLQSTNLAQIAPGVVLDPIRVSYNSEDGFVIHDFRIIATPSADKNSK